MVLRHVAQPQLGFKSLLWWYHSNRTHLKQLLWVWCCTLSTRRTPTISCYAYSRCLSPVFFESDISPGHDTSNLPHRVASEPRLLHWWTCERKSVVQDKQDPQFVWLLCIVRIILSESKAEDDGGSCCQNGETWQCTVWSMKSGCFWRS